MTYRVGDEAKPGDVYVKGRVIEHGGRSLNVRQWAAVAGVTEGAMRYRLARWTVERAVTTPSRGGGKAITTPLDRRFQLLTRVDDGCHMWLGSTDEQGYGVLYVPPRDRHMASGVHHVRAHRLAMLFDGRDPSGFSVLHSCDNPSCVNPDHLRRGTHEENMQDMTSRGRSARGVRQHLAKLDPERVRQMRRLYGQGVGTPTLGDMFGVRQSTAYNVVKRRTWRHVA